MIFVIYIICYSYKTDKQIDNKCKKVLVNKYNPIRIIFSI